MSNKFRPHVLVLPEDDANRQIANGFVLGVFSEPERLKAARGRSYEQIGQDLAAGCAAKTDEAWGHELLAHNAEEATRLMAVAGPVLF